ncbi:hypothetical protein EVAR_7157_1 [Eumeta japonica]|uniref:Uncharacterized protein n=1 Tax=Eumeta variegata TaxID=151549 RepID=A0A4C1U6E4_EUMVA|nr:hypothetical protein EVAR_7157_1 [Eumeta japonica]
MRHRLPDVALRAKRQLQNSSKIYVSQSDRPIKYSTGIGANNVDKRLSRDVCSRSPYFAESPRAGVCDVAVRDYVPFAVSPAHCTLPHYVDSRFHTEARAYRGKRIFVRETKTAQHKRAEDEREISMRSERAVAVAVYRVACPRATLKTVVHLMHRPKRTFYERAPARDVHLASKLYAFDDRKFY